jgi:uncharacterized membrane protein YeiH
VLTAALAFVSLHNAGCPREIAIVVAVVTGFALRAAAILWGWSLPHHRSEPGHDG